MTVNQKKIILTKNYFNVSSRLVDEAGLCYNGFYSLLILELLTIVKSIEHLEIKYMFMKSKLIGWFIGKHTIRFFSISMVCFPMSQSFLL